MQCNILAMTAVSKLPNVLNRSIVLTIHIMEIQLMKKLKSVCYVRRRAALIFFHISTFPAEFTKTTHNMSC